MSEKKPQMNIKAKEERPLCLLQEKHSEAKRTDERSAARNVRNGRLQNVPTDLRKPWATLSAILVKT